MGRDRIIQELLYYCDHPNLGSSDNYGAEIVMLPKSLVNAVVDLVEDKPVAPHLVDWGIYECRICKTRVCKTYKYCKCCGRAVKWE